MLNSVIFWEHFQYASLLTKCKVLHDRKRWILLCHDCREFKDEKTRNTSITVFWKKIRKGIPKKCKYSGVNSQEARIYRSAFGEDSIMTLPECQDSSEILLHTWAMLQTGKPQSPRSWALLVCMVGDSLLERTGTLHPDFFFSVETVFKEKK